MTHDTLPTVAVHMAGGYAVLIVIAAAGAS